MAENPTNVFVQTDTGHAAMLPIPAGVTEYPHL